MDDEQARALRLEREDGTLAFMAGHENPIRSCVSAARRSEIIIKGNWCSLLNASGFGFGHQQTPTRLMTPRPQREPLPLLLSHFSGFFESLLIKLNASSQHMLSENRFCLIGNKLGEGGGTLSLSSLESQ